MKNHSIIIKIKWLSNDLAFTFKLFAAKGNDAKFLNLKNEFSPSLKNFY